MSYKDEIKANVEPFDVLDTKTFEKIATDLSEEWTKRFQNMGLNTQINIENIIKKCKEASKNKKIDIIVGDEDEENLAELTAAEEIALTNLIKKSSPRSNNILILLENQKIKMKLENPYSNNGKIETIKMEFGEERNASKNPIEKTEI